MADRAAIERIAKILARATSENQGEAEAALHGAYGRMKRDGVTFSDLLSLPEEYLYQEALVRLAEHIVKNQTELSPPQRRTLYSEYLARIVLKFTDAPSSGAGEGDTRSRHEDDQRAREREREEAARAYEERRREEEARRAENERRERRPPPRDPPEGHGESTYNRKNGNTSKPPERDRFHFDRNRVPLDFSFRDLTSALFGRGSLLACFITYPFRGLVLVVCSGIASTVFSIILLLIASYLSKSVPTIGRPLLLLMGQWQFFGLPWFSLVLGFVFMFNWHEHGWFPIHRGRGEVGILDAIKMTLFAIPGIIWRIFVSFAWVANTLSRFARSSSKDTKANAPEPPRAESKSQPSKASGNELPSWLLLIVALVAVPAFLVYLSMLIYGVMNIIFGVFKYSPSWNSDENIKPIVITLSIILTVIYYAMLWNALWPSFRSRFRRE